MQGFERLRSRGLIRHWGVSNFDLADLHELLQLPGGAACASNQVWYSLTQRGVEFDLLPWQRQRQMPLMAYSPIDQGALARHAKLADLAARRGITPAQLALAWLLAQPGVMAVPKSSDAIHLRHNWQAAALRLEADDTSQLDRLFPPPRRKQPLGRGLRRVTPAAPARQPAWPGNAGSATWSWPGSRPPRRATRPPAP